MSSVGSSTKAPKVQQKPDIKPEETKAKPEEAKAKPEEAKPKDTYEEAKVDQAPVALKAPDTSSVNAATGTGNGNRPVRNAADVAQEHYNQTAAQMKADFRSGKSDFHMTSDAADDVCCANFVTASLEKAGQIRPDQHQVNVKAMNDMLDADKDNWERVTDQSKLQPGDVVCMGTPGSPYAHTELVKSNENGKLTLIGSNNTRTATGFDGPQQVSYGGLTTMSMTSAYHYKGSPPPGTTTTSGGAPGTTTPGAPTGPAAGQGTTNQNVDGGVAPPATSLKYGDQKPEVKQLQDSLVKLGYLDAKALEGGGAGVYGNRTAQAVARAQAKHNITDGEAGKVYGEKTRKALLEELNRMNAGIVAPPRPEAIAA